MRSVPLAKAKAKLSELVRLAGNGEPTQITVRGQPIAQIVSSEAPGSPLASAEPTEEPFDWDELARLTDSMPLQKESAGDFMRRLRDEERY